MTLNEEKLGNTRNKTNIRIYTYGRERGITKFVFVHDRFYLVM